MDTGHTQGTAVPAPTTHTPAPGAIMNVRLSDGSVRCGDHFDASSYVSETTDPCGYCPSPSPAPRATVRMDKGQCSWCSEPARWDVSDGIDPWTDMVCTEHKEEWFPGAIVPVSLHKVVTRPVPAEWQLTQRRTGQVAPWIYPGHREGMVANDLLTFQSLLIISTYVDRPAEERVSHPRVWPNYIDNPQY